MPLRRSRLLRPLYRIEGEIRFQVAKGLPRSFGDGLFIELNG